MSALGLVLLFRAEPASPTCCLHLEQRGMVSKPQEGSSPKVLNANLARARWRRTSRMTAFLRRLPHVWQQLIASNALVEKNPLHNKHERYLQKLRVGAHMVDPWLRETLAKAASKEATVQSPTVEAPHGVVLEVEDASVLADVPLWMQGDPELNTDTKIRQREKLRYHRRVLDALNDIYLAAMHSQHSFTNEEHLPTELSRDGHALMMIRVYKLMIKEYDPEQALKSIGEDWDNDSKGAATISRKGVFDSFFQLADTCELLLKNARRRGGDCVP